MFGRLHKLLLATTALVPLGLASAAANPLGGQVVGGSATVQGQGTATVTVTQQSNSAIINWNTFNVGTGEKTNIAMPSASSVQLDRVTGGLGPSQILGSLWSNGRVFLVNPDGILFGPGGKIDTAGFLATTHDIANSDFMAGRYNFSIPGRPDASVVNQGTITAQTGGFAALVAPGVRNSGTITATLGTVALASGNGFTLDFYGDKLITLGVSDSIATQVKDVATGQTLDTLVKNEGTLRANGGRVELTAAAARQVVDSVINTTGVIEANTIGTQTGMIVLGAAAAATKPAGAPTQTVKVSGTLSAAGKKKGTTGGTIKVTGEAIALTGATLDASGTAGGGTVLIGGDVGGGNPNPAVASIPQAQLQPYAVPTASTTTVDAATTINASATDSGDGGKVIVWSELATVFDGTIFARGGASFGNGGFVETSGHQQLAFNGIVDTGALNGKGGTLLLDPLNATIDTNPGSQVITVASIESALATGDVVVSTAVAGSDAGNITAAASVSWANASTLTLSANQNITINSGVTIANTGAGNLVLRADSAGTGVGTVNFIGTGKVDFSQSTGAISIFYNSADNPAGSVVNTTSYTSPTDYTPYVLTNNTVSNQLTAYMLVNSVFDLQNIQNNLSGTYALGKNIDASATVNWNGGAGFVPIGNNLLWFSGRFNGDGHTIGNLFIHSSASYVGLFGFIDPTGVVSNVGLTNANVSGGGTNPFHAYVGILAGGNGGAISKSYTTGTVTAGGWSIAGGLVGYNYGYLGTISESYSTASVTAGFNSYVGGLAGYNTGTIIYSYATGSVSGVLSSTVAGGLVGGYSSPGVIIESYSVGLVSGGANSQVGGLSGISSGPTQTSYSYWDTQTSGQGTSAAGAGLTTAQFKSGLPSGFNSAVWGSSPTINNGYPYLLWQTASTTPPTSPTILTPTALQLITVTADLQTKVYGSVDPLLTYHITSGSLSGSDAFSGTLTRAPGNNVGTYSINLGTLALPSAYTLTYVGATLTITPVLLTITANSTSRQVGTPNPTFTVSYSGFVAGDGPGVVSGLPPSTPATTSSPAGTYSIIPGGASALNYTISYVNGLLTVTSAPTSTPTPTPPPQTACVVCAFPNIGTTISQDLNYAATIAKNLVTTAETDIQKAEQLFTSFITPQSTTSTVSFAPVLAEIKADLGQNTTDANPVPIGDVISALGFNPGVVYHNGYIYPVGYTDDPTQCVALVHALDPTLKPGTGGTPNWTTGSWVTASNLTLRFGDAIATFDKNGSYTDTHAAIFLGYYPPNGVPKGMYILDQNTTTNGGHAEVRLRLFDTMPTLSGDGYAYATVELRNTTVTQ